MFKEDERKCDKDVFDGKNGEEKSCFGKLVVDWEQVSKIPREFGSVPVAKLTFLVAHLHVPGLIHLNPTVWTHPVPTERKGWQQMAYHTLFFLPH